MKLNTILVLEECDKNISVHSFTNDEQGSKEANALFEKLASEQDGYFSTEEIKEGRERCSITNEAGDWSLLMIESEK